MRKAISRLIPERNSTSAWWQISASQGRSVASHKLYRQTAPAQRIGIGLVGRAKRGKGLSSDFLKKWQKIVRLNSVSLHHEGREYSLRAMEIALFQPDQPQNTGTLLRLGACMDVPVHIIEPCGFPFSHRALKRSAMDYADAVKMIQHVDWQGFEEARRASGQRLILLTTKGETAYTDFEFTANDILMVGSESSGVPEIVHKTADACVVIPMDAKMRSINVAISMGMVLGEALRQTGTWPEGN